MNTRGEVLFGLTCTDVDRSIAEGPETRRLLTRFLPWATKSYRLAKLVITPGWRTPSSMNCSPFWNRQL